MDTNTLTFDQVEAYNQALTDASALLTAQPSTEPWNLVLTLLVDR